MAALGHFLMNDAHIAWIAVDDGKRVNELTGLIGCALLTVLNAIDRIEQLKANSEFRDLGLVMALYLQFSREVECLSLSPTDNTDWQEVLLQYAAKAEIDLSGQGVAGLDNTIDLTREPLAGKPTATRWNWLKTVSPISFISEHTS